MCYLSQKLKMKKPKKQSAILGHDNRNSSREVLFKYLDG